MQGFPDKEEDFVVLPCGPGRAGAGAAGPRRRASRLSDNCHSCILYIL